MTRTRIVTSGAPTALGPYSQAIAAGDLMFCSGQTGRDPSTGELAGDFAGEVERAIRNIGHVLDGAGVGFGDVVKTTLFLIDIERFSQANDIYRRFFPDPPPARSTVGVAALPGGAAFEIEAIAVRPAGRTG